MAEERETSQTVEKPVQAAPSEPDIDSLLITIPAFNGLFAEGSASAEQTGQPEQSTKEAPVTEPGAPETAAVPEVQIPEGLKPEEETPLPEPEPKKEEVLSDKIQKRIDELTAKRKSAEERASSLETELNDLKAKFSAPPPLAPTPANPLADIETEADLAARMSQVMEAKSWAYQNLDGGNVSDGKGGVQFLDGPTVKAILANADQILSKHIPERRAFLESKKTFDNEARREYPAIFKEGSEAQKTYKQWLTVFPECRRYPDIALIVGDALVGQKIRYDRAKARSSKNGAIPSASHLPLAAPAPAASPRVPQTKALSGEALAAAFQANPEAALDNFVSGLIDGAASQRAAQR